MKRQKGASLVELMIASLLGLILSSAILSTLYASIRSNSLKISSETLQENSSLALYFLANDIRTIGFSGCYKQDLNSVNNNSIGPVSEHLSNLPIIVGKTKQYKKSDAITFVTTLSAGVDTAIDMATVHSSVDLIKNTLIDEQQELLITDCTQADLFAVTDIWNNRLSHDLSLNKTSNLSYSYPKGSHVYPLSLVSYYLAKGASGRTGLYRKVNNKNANEIIPNVELLMIRYGVKSPINRMITYYFADQSFNDNQVVSLQLKFLLSSHNEVLEEKMQYLDLHNNLVQAKDLRLYKTFSLDIALRNRG